MQSYGYCAKELNVQEQNYIGLIRARSVVQWTIYRHVLIDLLISKIVIDSFELGILNLKV